MDQLDIYYRAFLEYRKNTAGHKESARHRDIIAHSNSDGDRLESVKYFCTIKEDWIAEIEKGLVFVEKAINEQRQFIRSDGEVVPIEKAKHVSKHSVQHLARHAEYITREPEDGEDDLVPDKLFMLERDSDFAVYENRFLYMLLRYLVDFIDIRLDRINELGNTYRGSMGIKKSISLGKRHIDYEVSLSEERRNDPYSSLNDEAVELVHRIEGVEHWVMSLLATPLMEQVAKVPMIHPPITKTNVLRMNNNFKGAVALYDYVTSYEGDGYTIEERKKIVSPFGDIMSDEFADIVMLTSFLTYEYGTDIKDILKASYEAEEERRRREEQEKLAAQISALKKRIVDTGESSDTYMLLLEKRNKALEADSKRLEVELAENERLNGEIKELTNQREKAYDTIAELEFTVAEKNAEIEDINIKYETDMAALKAEHAAAIEAIMAENAERIARLEAEQKEQIEMARKDYAERLETARREMSDEKQAAFDEYRQKTLEAQAIADELVARYTEENERLTKDNTLVRAQLHGLRQQNGLSADEDDFTSKERFEELEREFEAFKARFDGEWKKTKKRIRKDMLWTLKKPAETVGQEDMTDGEGTEQ